MNRFSQDILSKKPNALDKDLKLPNGYTKKKEICTLLRQLFQLQETDDVSNEFYEVTDLKKIEQNIFGNIINMEQDFFVVRLYVRHNVLQNFSDKLMGRFASITQQVGTAHLGVQIGETVLHWFNSSFVIPKEWKGAGATAVFYPQKSNGDEVPAIENTPENRMKVCQVIQNWNITKTYNSVHANCQMFAGDIFKALGFNENFSKYQGWVGDFVRYMSDIKNQEKVLYPCLIKGNTVLKEWKNHQELDEWHAKGEDKSFPEAYSLLKAFHRAFQMRGDHTDPKLLHCPFDSPTLLIGNDGEKLNVNDMVGYSDPGDSYLKGFSKGDNLSGGSRN